ncbi:MAG: hypothetical protein BWY61_01681 [Firmicutes bacterium ADurb.Bin354]|nr:MAG: hypothetical protein BWY61_01681 [Firmicutes bacterium ADurb.Bin354]SCX89122.1 hypothetical protein SAMN02910370_00564 [Lachnospiraceae bacterium XPB1003]
MTKWEGLLPIGSVVILNNGEKKLMIVGQSQTPAGEPEKIFDYSAVLYPQGFYDRNNTYLFNHEDIKKIYYIGYMDDMEIAYMETLEPIHKGMQSGEITLEEADRMVEEVMRDRKKEGF